MAEQLNTYDFRKYGNYWKISKLIAETLGQTPSRPPPSPPTNQNLVLENQNKLALEVSKETPISL